VPSQSILDVPEVLENVLRHVISEPSLQPLLETWQRLGTPLQTPEQPLHTTSLKQLVSCSCVSTLWKRLCWKLLLELNLVFAPLKVQHPTRNYELDLWVYPESRTSTGVSNMHIHPQPRWRQNTCGYWNYTALQLTRYVLAATENRTELQDLWNSGYRIR
jgi:hypothetical protein